MKRNEQLPHLEPSLDVCGHLDLREPARADGVVELVEAIQDGMSRVLGSFRHLEIILCSDLFTPPTCQY